jgi:lipopolysaccharide biosynthesis protein
MAKPLFIALYLPQYHPIKENDEWWGVGFTEWTNVTKAKPLFRGHEQPDLPSELGFYDLRLSDSRLRQAQLAHEYGIDGFCYYHYWFGHGRKVLEKPLQAVLELKEPDFPFMLCWANQSWTGAWHGLDKKVLIEQMYPGPEDDEQHFAYLSRAFSDARYIRRDGKPVLMVYRPTELPAPLEWTRRWREMAKQAGFPGLFLVCEHPDPEFRPEELGFDAFVNMRHIPRRREWISWREPIRKLANAYAEAVGRPVILDAKRLIDYFVPTVQNKHAIVCAVPNWDNTPRSGKAGVIMKNTQPEFLRAQLQKANKRVEARGADDQMVFIKSWNEWAEGNYLEPGRKWGRAYLDVVKQIKSEWGSPRS